MKPTLPEPNEEQSLHSQTLCKAIRDLCAQHGDKLPFDDYMRMALYEPGLGYYAAGSTKFNEAGDFTTAPEISSIFSKTLAKQCEQIIKTLQGSEPVIVLELGAGMGTMACDVLSALTESNQLPDEYWILEVSPDLRAKQQAQLKKAHPQYYDNIQWLDTLPEQPFNGMIIGNEVIDAMPVARFFIQAGNIKEMFVAPTPTGFDWQVATPRPALQQAVEQLQSQGFTFEEGYHSEVLLTLQPWLNAIAACLNKGVMLFIDYGFKQQEFYHPQRMAGTLMCHYRHFAHSDPFLYPGLQDITAHVDFSALYQAALSNGLQGLGYTNQASFLINCGLDTVCQKVLEAGYPLPKMSQEVQKLTLPHEMGELFKVIALGKGFSTPLIGFQDHNKLYTLNDNG